MNYQKPHVIFSRLWATGLLLFSASFVNAQQVSSDEAEIIELSPFTVDAAQDQGYLATNTLAGSRLNSALRDTAAPISVFTKDLLQDLGANDIQSATFYAVNAEEFTEAEIGDQTGNQLQNDGLQFNIRGFKTTATRNYFEWGLNSDNYNVDRVDFSRGPNSILYGLGSPGGVVNTSTKQAMMRNAYGLELQAGSYDAYRVALDINQMIVDQKLALRLNVLKADENSWRRTGYKDQERFHAAATWTPFRYTRIRAEYETADIDQGRPRPWGPLDGFSAWVNAGSQSIATARGPIPTGAGSLGGNTRLTFSSDGSPVADWSNMGRSDSGRFNYNIFDFDLVPRWFDAIGFGGRIDNTYDTTSLYLEQRIVEDLFVEISYNKQESTGQENRPINWNAPLTVDINRQLPNGSANPNFGKFYVEDNFRAFISEGEQEILRATASYELDFREKVGGRMGSILGRHRLAGLLEQREDQSIRRNLRELNSTPFQQTTNLSHALNRIYRRTYIDFATGEGIDGAMNPYGASLPPQSVTVRTGQSGTVTPGFFTDGFSGSISELDTRMIALQSYWWDGRVVTTYGNRRDERKTRGASTTRNLNVITDFAFDQPFGPSQSGSTETYGIVFHVTPVVSVFYNDSQSVNLGNPNRFTIDGTTVGDERGIGEDIGLRFNLLDNRLSLSVSHYETASVNRLTFNAEGNLKTAANDIWEVVDLSRFVDESLPVASTEDLVSDGYEVELVANPTDQWSIIANFSSSDTAVSNLGGRNVAYIEANRGTWSAASARPISGSTNYATVGQALAFIDDQIRTRIDPFEGRTKLSHADFKGSLFTNYRFASDTSLKGFSVGGGIRYVGTPVTGFSATDANGGYRTYKGDSNFVVDAKVGYKRKIMNDRVSWSLQLNVGNLLGNDDIIITLADLTGTSQRYRFQDPRDWTLTSRFEF